MFHLERTQSEACSETPNSSRWRLQPLQDAEATGKDLAGEGDGGDPLAPALRHLLEELGEGGDVTGL